MDAQLNKTKDQFISLVTGGAGFIGSHVARELISLGHRVVVLDDLSGGFMENLAAGVEFTQGSITNVELVNSLFEKNNFDYVYHLAAYAAEGLSHFIRRFNYENNLMGSINLINASIRHKVKCFVFTSSIAVYGKAQLPMHEDMVPIPEDPYGISKLAVELDLKSAHDMFGLNYVIFRPHNVYGEQQNIADRYRNVIGIFMNQLKEKKAITIFGDGTQTRAFTYIGDITRPIAHCVNMEAAQNQVFNIGADTRCTVNELADAVFKAMDVIGEKTYLTARNEVDHAYSDHERAKKTFQYDVATPLEEGLLKMATWAKNSKNRSSSKFENIEISDKLPASWKD